MGPEGRVRSVNSARFGDLPVEEDKVITLPTGLFGFEDLRQFILLEHGEGDSPFRWLHSVEDGSVAFLVMDARLVISDYLPQVDPDIRSQLGLEPSEDLAVLNILRVHSGGREVTANLRAPVFVGSSSRIGFQAILDDDRLSTRFSITGSSGTRKGEADAGP